MKKIPVLLAATLFLGMTGFAQKPHHHSRTHKKVVKEEVAPAAVQDAFKQGFGDAQDLKWKKTATGNWDATFTSNSLPSEATYSESGSMIAMHTNYTAQSLPQTILDAIKAKYPDATIKEGVKIQYQDVAAYYRVSVDNAGAAKDLLVNETGTTVTE